MSLLENYNFEDCLVIELHVSPQLEQVSIKCEAVLPLGEDEATRKKGLLLISCRKLLKFSAMMSQELLKDLAKPYDPKGNDLRANDIIDLSAYVGQQNQTVLLLQSDMLELYIECFEFSIEQRRSQVG